MFFYFRTSNLKMVNKKFSILTSAYNSGLYLNEWAKSIIKQDYRPIEVVFVNDKSKDNTIKLIPEFEKKFKENNIEFVFINNKKRYFCGSGYNVALEKATGSYFGVLDSDDMLESYACSFVVNLYEKYPEVTWLYTQYNKYNKYMNRIIKKGFCKNPSKNKTILDNEKSGTNIFSHWRTFSDKLLQKDTIFKKKLKCCVDKYMGYRMEELGIGMFANKICYRYRTRTKSSRPISFHEPLSRVRWQVILEAKRRRKKEKIKCFSILKCKKK